jgi:hypothetical protein
MAWARPAAAVLFSLALAGCAAVDGCVNTPLLTVSSPDGQRVAVAFERSCGATTGFSTQLSILPATHPLPSGEGNLFVARELFAFSLHWRDSGHLDFSFLAADVVRSHRALDGVAVAYLREAPDPRSPQTWTPRWPQPLDPGKTHLRPPPSPTAGRSPTP